MTPALAALPRSLFVPAASTTKPYNPPPPRFATPPKSPPPAPPLDLADSNRTTNLFMAKTLDEADVGICCYVSSLPGFRGVLKQRYSDFIVHEVDPEGMIVRLSSLDLPAEDCEEKEEKVSGLCGQSYANEIEAFRSLAGEADAEMLESFITTVGNGVEKGQAPALIVLSPDADKTHRAEIHDFFKKNFKFMITDTVEESGNLKRVRVRFCPADGGDKGRGGRKRKGRGDKSSKDDRPFDSRGSDNWPEHLGKFCRFHLCKENKDTQEALGVIGKMLGIQIRSFGFAGTKDKRSVSTQRVTVFKQHAKRLAALNNRLLGIRLGNFSYVREGLVLGQLSGNHFTITLRGVVADSEDTIKAAASGLGRNGFINYYGLQRFGSGSVPTHLIGAALLRGEWKAAANLILDPRDGERTAIRDVREYYKKTGDIDGSLRQFPRYLLAERSILQCLKKCPGNYLQALRAIPRTLRMMYVHSYQSYLWNHAATARVQKHGTADVILGDLVFRKDFTAEKSTQVENVKLQDDIYKDPNFCPMDEISESVVLEEDIHPVKVVNAKDLLEGCYTFEDVVLPLPGSRVIYPENEISGVYQELAEKDAVSLTESVHGAKEFSLTSMTGGYRKVFQQPIDFTWELLNYRDLTTPLAETDLDDISKARVSGIFKEHHMARCCNQQESKEDGKKNLACSSEAGDEQEVDPACSSDAQPPQIALKLGFILPTSCYATMAIRELLKTSTAVAFQKTLNI